MHGSALGAQCGHGAGGGGARPVGRTRPQGEPGLGRGERSRMVPGPGPARARGGVQQQGGGVDLVLGEGEPVSSGRTGDDVGAQLRPRPGDEDLHRLPRPLGQLVRPQPFHEPLAAAARAQVACQQREKAADPGRGDLLSAIGDTRQQGQVGGHPCRLGLQAVRGCTSRRRASGTPRGPHGSASRTSPWRGGPPLHP